jgi:hypothetical protein
VKNERLEGESSCEYLKKACSSLGCLDLGECVERFGKPIWMNTIVDLGRFGCSYGGILRKVPNSWMRHLGALARFVGSCND